MKRNRLVFIILFCVLIVPWALYACDFNDPGENIYKHYVGTIGSRHIVLDLRYGYCGASNFNGSYFYEPGSNTIKRIIITQPHTSDHNTTFHAFEYIQEDDWNEALNRQPTVRPDWMFTMYGNKLSGKWMSPDGKTLDIDLIETAENAVPLEMLCYTDKIENSVVEATMRYDFVGVMPAKRNDEADATFVNNSLLAFANTTSLSTDNWLDFPQKQSREMMTEYEKGVASDTLQHGSKMDYSGFSLLFPLYNENGFLTMEYEQFKKLPPDNVNWGNRYKNIDVRMKRTWQQKDILTADDATITKLLQDEYAGKVDAKSEKYALKDKIAATANIAVMHDGLMFCPVVSSAWRDEEIRIFIPYSRLGNMLTKDFTDRLKSL